MAEKRILFDKTEIVVMFPTKKKFISLSLAYNDIVRIQFDSCEERKLFKKIPSEKITITTGKWGTPIVYTKAKEKKFFEEYKQGLEKFCKDNRVTFINNLNDE
jgi:non-homologous end joining protein Ku